MQNKLLSFLILAVLVFFTGCATTKISLKPEFWQTKDARIGVAVTKAPRGKTYKSGSQGLLDIVVNNALAGSLESSLQKADAANFAKSSDELIRKLAQKGISAKKIDEPIDLSDFAKFKSKGPGEFSHYDFRHLAQEHKIDQLVLFSIDRMGTVRSYYGMLPLGAPKPFCEATGRLINLENNEIMWLYTMGNAESIVPVEGPWDQAPRFPNVNMALQKAIDSAAQKLVNKFE
ncbi:MAG: hypothetical protein WCK42_00230 [Myxococcaceae bacterium]